MLLELSVLLSQELVGLGFPVSEFRVSVFGPLHSETELFLPFCMCRRLGSYSFPSFGHEHLLGPGLSTHDHMLILKLDAGLWDN
jgi:hypothetical protein